MSRVNQRRWLASKVPLSCAGQRPRTIVSRACQWAMFGTLSSSAPPGRAQPAARRSAASGSARCSSTSASTTRSNEPTSKRQVGVLERALHDGVGDLRRGARGGRRQLESRQVPGSVAQQREQPAGRAAEVQHAAALGQQLLGALGDRAVAEGGIRLRPGLVELRERGIDSHASERTAARRSPSTLRPDASELGPTMTSDVAVVIVNFNGEGLLGDCLAALDGQTLSPAEVLVADNGSVDGSVALLRAEHPNVGVLELGRNFGFAGGANRGVAATSRAVGLRAELRRDARAGLALDVDRRSS